MPAINESIVREYFETLGYLVSQPCKYGVPGRHKKAEEELDLLVQHPLVTEHRVPERIVWTTVDLGTVARAIVGVWGWHSERIYLGRFQQMPEMLRFAEPAVRRLAEARLGGGPVAAILCLPELPVSGELKEKTLHGLKERGVDGVLSFRTMLQELIVHVDANRNYEKSDVLQLLRILKTYRLVKDSQMELFGTRKRRRRAPRPEASPAT